MKLNANIIKKAADIVSAKEDIYIGVINKEGYPHVSTISKLKEEGIYKIWFSSTTDGYKAACLKENGKASVCVHSGDDNVTLIGTITVRTDAEIKKELWQDWLIHHYTEGPEAPNYCVFEFETEEVSLWVDRVVGKGRIADILVPQSRCGGLCNTCEYQADGICEGCLATNGNPMWGACPVSACCIDKGHEHCGFCPEVPCELLDSFYKDEEQGDRPYGARLEMVQKWGALQSE